MKALGAEVIEEQLHPEHFGNAQCVLAAQNQPPFKLVWDGKQGVGFLQVKNTVGVWTDIGPCVSGTDNQSLAFAGLIATAKELIGGHADVMQNGGSKACPL
jgi:hypothetical protein